MEEKGLLARYVVATVYDHTQRDKNTTVSSLLSNAAAIYSIKGDGLTFSSSTTISL